MIREALVDNFHHNLIYPILVSGDAQKNQEIAHDRILRLLEEIEKRPLLRKAITKAFEYSDPRLQVEVAGLNFQNPLGIAAGFDKDGIAPNAICALGYSFIEIGTIPPQPQMGESQPRVFALPKDGAMINRMAFPSKGMDFIYNKLSEDPTDPGKIRGVNIGPNACSVKKGIAVDDYITATEKFLSVADYIALNVSSPNTFGLRELQRGRELSILTREVKSKIIQHRREIPLAIKLAPDLEKQEVLNILNAIYGHADCVIVSNSTIDPSLRAQLTDKHSEEQGGISGRPLTSKALEMSHFIYEETSGKLPIIRSGGVMTPQDYWDALTCGGASLVQLYTAFTDKTTSTPNLAYYMNKFVVGRMEELGVKNLKDVRGMKEEAINSWAIR